MRVIFFGTQDWAAEILESLITDETFDVVCVVTQPDKPVGRKQILTASPVKQTALKHHLPIFQPTKLREPAFLQTLKAFTADVAVVMAYGRLLPQELLLLTPHGVVNVHPSLLPKWRGPTPVQSAIASGEMYSGATVMKIDEQMDHGPILSQQQIKISSDETLSTFMNKVVVISGPLLKETLHAYVSGVLHPQPQNEQQATYCKLLTRIDGKIDWNLTATEIEQKIRAYTPWPGTWTEGVFHTRSIRLKVLRAHSADALKTHAIGTLFSENNRLFVSTSLGAIEIDEIQPEGKSVLSARAFLTGYDQLLGQILSSSLEEKETRIK